MKKYLISTTIILSLLILFFLNFTFSSSALINQAHSNNYYQTKTIHNRDGIGKYYLGREIAQVMGHQAMMWLERPSRESTEQPQAVVEALNLQSNSVVADLGAGTGYFAFKIAAALPQGKVLAVDIQPEMLEVINFLKTENHVDNVETILGQIDNPQLPANSIDLALMVDAYHEFEYPREMMEGVVKALKPGGKVVLVEYRLENPLILIKPLHKMSQKQVKKEMKAVGLVWQETEEFLPQQHFFVFTKPVYFVSSKKIFN